VVRGSYPYDNLCRKSRTFREAEMTVKELIKQLGELEVDENAVVKVYDKFGDIFEAGDVDIHDMKHGSKVPEFVVIW